MEMFGHTVLALERDDITAEFLQWRPRGLGNDLREVGARFVCGPVGMKLAWSFLRGSHLDKSISVRGTDNVSGHMSVCGWLEVAVMNLGHELHVAFILEQSQGH